MTNQQGAETAETAVWVCAHCGAENSPAQLSCQRCLRGAPHAQEFLAQQHQSPADIIKARTILFLLLLLSLFGPWGTGWAESRPIYEGMTCRGLVYQGICHYPLSGWQLFFYYPICSCLLVWPALLLLYGGVIAYRRRRPSRLYLLGVLFFVGSGMYVLGYEITNPYRQPWALFWRLHWGGILATCLALAALVVELLDWRRARKR